LTRPPFHLSSRLIIVIENFSQLSHAEASASDMVCSGGGATFSGDAAMRRIILLIAALSQALIGAEAIAQAPALPSAPDWQPLTDPRHFISFSWDRASVVRDGDVVRAVVRVTPRIISAGPGYADFLTEIRCADRRSRVVRTTNYGRRGEPLIKNSVKAKFRHIKSDQDNILHAAVCPGAPLPPQ
jgi:hypothetical protein